MEIRRKKNSAFPDYPYDLFCEELKNGQFKCLIPNCNKTFISYAEYIAHFTYNYRHFHYIKRTLDYYVDDKEDYKKRGIVIDPIEREQIAMNVKYDKDFINLRYAKNVSYILEEKIDFAVNEDKMIVGFVTGLQGAGKSFFALALADVILDKEEEKRGTRPKIHVGFERDDTLQLVKEAQEGDVIIQDEVPMGSGFGDATGQKRLKNLLLVLRKAHIHFLFVSPKKSDISGLQFAIEVLEYNKYSRVSKAVLYTKKFVALGYCYVQVLDADEPILIDYLEKKDEFVEKIKQSGGSDIDNLNEEEFDADVELVYDIIKKKNPNMKKSLIEKEVALYVKQNTRYQSWVTAEVAERLKEDRIIGEITLQTPKTAQYRDGELEIEHIDADENAGILNTIYNKALKIYKDKKMNDIVLLRGIHYFKFRYIDEMIETDAMTEVNKLVKPEVQRISMRNALKKFKQNLIGYAAEDALLEDYAYKFEDVEKMAGQNEPDFKNDEYVGEIKIRKADDKRTPEWYIKNKCVYLKEYLDAGDEVKFVLIYYDFGKAIVNIYDIKKVEDT